MSATQENPFPGQVQSLVYLEDGVFPNIQVVDGPNPAINRVNLQINEALYDKLARDLANLLVQRRARMQARTQRN